MRRKKTKRPQSASDWTGPDRAQPSPDRGALWIRRCAVVTCGASEAGTPFLPPPGEEEGGGGVLGRKTMLMMKRVEVGAGGVVGRSDRRVSGGGPF